MASFVLEDLSIQKDQVLVLLDFIVQHKLKLIFVQLDITVLRLEIQDHFLVIQVHIHHFDSRVTALFVRRVTNVLVGECLSLNFVQQDSSVQSLVFLNQLYNVLLDFTALKAQ